MAVPAARARWEPALPPAEVRGHGDRQRLFTRATVEQKRELGFELRGGLLGGWARALLRDSRNELVGGAGLSVNREKTVEGETTTNLEAAAGFD